MSFAQAYKCFAENSTRISAHADPAAHNVSAGLAALTRAIQSQLDDIERRMRRCEDALAHIQSKGR